jgi:hypothetical protein
MAALTAIPSFCIHRPMWCREKGSQAWFGESWAHDLVVLAWGSDPWDATHIPAGIFPFHAGESFRIHAINFSLNIKI